MEWRRQPCCHPLQGQREGVPSLAVTAAVTVTAVAAVVGAAAVVAAAAAVAAAATAAQVPRARVKKRGVTVTPPLWVARGGWEGRARVGRSAR